MKDLKHIKRFNESEENLNISDDLIVRVKHLIQYLQENFDPESTVHLDKDGWMKDELNATDEIDLIKKRGTFEKWDGKLFINN